MRILITLLSIEGDKRSVAINRSNNIICHFMEYLSCFIKVNGAISKYLKNITILQKKWKRIFNHTQLRKSILKKKWDEVFIKLTNQYTKSKKQPAILRKMRKITSEVRDNAILEYYKKQINKYYHLLTKWLIYKFGVCHYYHRNQNIILV